MNIIGHHHCFYQLKYHLVLVTKYKEKCLSAPILKDLKVIVDECLKKARLQLIHFKGANDHIKITFAAHPSVELSKFIGNLKTVSSRLIRKNHYDHLEKYAATPNLWTRAYGLLSAGQPNETAITDYINNQGIDRRYSEKTKRKRIKPIQTS